MGQGGKGEGDMGSESHEVRESGGRGADKNKDTKKQRVRGTRCQGGKDSEGN